MDDKTPAVLTQDELALELAQRAQEKQRAQVEPIVVGVVLPKLTLSRDLLHKIRMDGKAMTKAAKKRARHGFTRSSSSTLASLHKKG